MCTCSPYAQELLVKVLLHANFMPADLGALLDELGLSEVRWSLDLTGAPDVALSKAIAELCQRVYIREGETQLLEAIEAKLPGSAREFREIRIAMEIDPPANPILSASEFRELTTSLRQAGLHDGLPYSRLQFSLPADVRRRSSKCVQKANQLEAWFRAANRQEIEPGDPIWMEQLLPLAIQHGKAPGTTKLQRLLDRLQLTTGRDVRSLPEGKLGELQQIVNLYGVMTDAVQFVERMTTALGRVCLIRIAGNDIGTGFLVGPDLLLTAYHNLTNVIGGDMDADSVLFVFDYCTKDRQVMEGPKVGLFPGTGDDPRAWLIDASPPTQLEWDENREPDIETETSPEYLDFALVRLAERIGDQPSLFGRTRGCFSLNAARSPYNFPKGAALMIVGHPRSSTFSVTASPQIFSLEPDSVIKRNPNNTRVRYRTNTMKGSSGSPVLSVQWELVAMHHFGRKYSYNQGIPIQAIAQREKVSAAVAAQ